MLSLLAETSQIAANAIHFEDLGLRKGIDLGFFELRFYSLAYLAGIVLGYWHLTKMIKAPGSPLAQRHADDLFFWCTVGIILGGRLGYAAFYTGGETGIPSLFSRPLDLLKLWEGGMSFHGGVLGVLAAIARVCHQGKISFLRTADYLAVCVPPGMLFGRLANFVNGELWGRPTDMSWAMIFPEDPTQLARHPSQLYQAGLEGLLPLVVLLLLFWKTKARWRPGLLVGVFTVLVSIGRFVSEFFREPDAQLAEFARSTGLSMGQWLTIPLILVGLFFVIRALTRPPVGNQAGQPAPA
nr:prolipoprotein diacylglyceryl transferase [Tsuneonella troitsensis]